MTDSNLKAHGFTLIELSVVLVIIGLIVGGVLVGQNLISSAVTRATIAQIEKYNTAVNTFRGKYGYLPGDINVAAASQFGFAPRTGNRGEGDGNGVIEGCGAGAVFYNYGGGYGSVEQCGELALFWVDLGLAHLIDGTFTTAQASSIASSTLPDNYFPQAKLGNGNYVYVTSGGIGADNGGGDNGLNYFSIGPVNTFQDGGIVANVTTMSVQQAYDIDKKIDDGLPQSGRVLAFYSNYNVPWIGTMGWAAGGGTFGANDGTTAMGPTAAPTPYAMTNCYDNNNIAGPQTYSMTKNAAQLNCALSFQFQ